MLGVEPSQGDPIWRDDVVSAKRYREAMERELIKRRPGQYPQGWLADRLGVSERSIRTYHHGIPIQAAARFITEPVTRENYQQMFPRPVIAQRAGIDLRGRFLEDETGKRYPAKEGIAQRLLGHNHCVWLKQRTYNEYWYDDSLMEMSGDLRENGALGEREARDLETRGQFEEKLRQGDARVQAYFEQREITQTNVSAPIAITRGISSPREAKRSVPILGEQSEVNPAVTTGQGSKRRRRGYGQPLQDERAEALAHQIHAVTSETRYQAMSIRNARRLVETYGVGAVEAAFKKMVWLRDKGRIADPAGFMLVAARVSWRLQQGQTELRKHAPRFEGEKRRKRRMDDPKEAVAWRCLRELVLVTSDAYCLWRMGWEIEQGDWLEAGYWLSKVEVEFPW